MEDLIPPLGYRRRYPAQRNMDTHNTSNAEYAACHDRYHELADQMRPYAFYSHVTSEGLSRYFASCLLRDCYGMDLIQCKQIIDLRINRTASQVVETAPVSNPSGLCKHLSPVLEHLKSQHNAVEIATRNGKGWGYVSLVNNLPRRLDWDADSLPDCVTISKERQIISCCECWSNIADHDRYRNNWG